MANATVLSRHPDALPGLVLRVAFLISFHSERIFPEDKQLWLLLLHSFVLPFLHDFSLYPQNVWVTYLLYLGNCGQHCFKSAGYNWLTSC